MKLKEPKHAGRWFLSHNFYQKPDKCRPHMQSVLTKLDTTNILLSPSHLTSHNDILRRMAFGAVLLTAYPRSGRLHVWLQRSRRSAVPADSVIPRLCACRHVSGDHGALSLWPHCVLEGNNKAAGTKASPEPCHHLTRKFLRRISGS